MLGAGRNTTAGRAWRIAVEGNIAAGKSTLLAKLQEMGDVQIVHEPVERWRSCSGGNVLGRLYQDPQRWAFTFQSYVLKTMLDAHENVPPQPSHCSIRVLERSVYSARYCFVNNLHNQGLMDDMEYNCYCEWFDHVVQRAPPPLDLIVYLRADPVTCMDRIKLRNREEEKDAISMEYLGSLHKCYEDWLMGSAWGQRVPVLVIDANLDSDKENDLHLQMCLQIKQRLLAQRPPADPARSLAIAESLTSPHVQRAARAAKGARKAPLADASNTYTSSAKSACAAPFAASTVAGVAAAAAAAGGDDHDREILASMVC